MIKELKEKLELEKSKEKQLGIHVSLTPIELDKLEILKTELNVHNTSKLIRLLINQVC